MQAIEVNGVAVKMNTQAFHLGRLAAHDPARLAPMMKGRTKRAPKTLDAMSLDEIIAHRSALLTAYQDAGSPTATASGDQVRNAAVNGGFGDELPRAVAINYAKLLAYKDEYEVARLFTDGRFEKQLRDQFEGDFKFASTSRRRCSRAPTRGADGGSAPSARRMMPLFRILAKSKVLRGTPFDVFAYSPDRRLERDLIAGYEKDVATVLGLLSPDNIDTAVELLSLPDRIRGYGPVKEKAVRTPKCATPNSPPTSSTRRRRRGRSRRSRQELVGWAAHGQIRRDRASGLNTAGFISGYRGSPLGGDDQQLFAARKHLEQYNIKFQPGVNEDLAATAVWGSQQLNLLPGAKYDGVVGIWYGKGPGVDRCGDVFRHGNAAGSAKNGGVFCLAGDDHGAKSSTVPHQSDHAFMSALMPYLYPSSIHEMIEMGLLGIAMSRYSGCWVGMKVITETVETTAEIDLTDEMTPFVIPTDFEMPQAGSICAGPMTVLTRTAGSRTTRALPRSRLRAPTRSTASPWIRRSPLRHHGIRQEL